MPMMAMRSRRWAHTGANAPARLLFLSFVNIWHFL
jgi:hypothetical protein